MRVVGKKLRDQHLRLALWQSHLLYQQPIFKSPCSTYLIQLPTNAPEKAVDDGPSPWVPATQCRRHRWNSKLMVLNPGMKALPLSAFQIKTNKSLSHFSEMEKNLPSVNSELTTEPGLSLTCPLEAPPPSPLGSIPTEHRTLAPPPL